MPRGEFLTLQTLAARKLAQLPVVTCAAPSYLKKHGVPCSLEGLGAHLFINFFSARTGRIFEVDFERDGKRTALEPRHQVAANDSQTWLALAVAGLGLVQTPLSPDVRALLGAGKLRRVLASWQSEPLATVRALSSDAAAAHARARLYRLGRRGVSRGGTEGARSVVAH